MIYYVLVLFCQKTAEIYIPLSLNCKYMMNQNSSGFLSSIPMVTKNLIIINLLFWVASLVLPKVGIDLVQLFGLHFPGVKDFYPFQFVTYMFMHDTHSFAHVFFNMFGVYMFGRVLENVWGPKRFLIFYMVTGIGAGITQELVWLYSVHSFASANGVTLVQLVAGDPSLNYLITIGASGSVFGILLAFAMLFPNVPLYLMFIPIPIKAKYFVIFYGLAELFMGVANNGGDSVAHFAHLGGFPFLQYLQVPSSPELLLYRPWTIITYMFTHFDFLHILFNMLWLYWFGGLFLTFFSERQLGGLYLLGGIAGAVLFLVAYNIFPYFRTVAAYSYLMGASASVMAIVFAVSFYRKDLEIGLFLIGRIKLIYLALFTFVIDLLAITSTNAGGHIAHIGGALFGIWFAARIKEGKDLTAPMNRLLDWVVNLGKRKPKMRVTYKRPETDYEYNARKHRETVDLDAILDKLKRSGYESLSAEEKKKLFDASKK